MWMIRHDALPVENNPGSFPATSLILIFFKSLIYINKIVEEIANG